MINTANVQVEKTYSMKCFVKDAMTVGVAATIAFIIPHYTPKAELTKIPDHIQVPHKAQIKSIIVSQTSYANPKQYAKYALIEAYQGDGHMNEERRVNNSEITTFPVEYGGKLPVAPENEFTIDNSREYVDISHKVQKISMPVVYRGKLPVGRER